MSKKTESAPAAEADPNIDPLAELQEIRNRIEEKKQQLAEVDQAPVPLEEAVSSLARKAKLLAEAGEEKFSAFVSGVMFPDTARYARPEDSKLSPEVFVHLFLNEFIAAGHARLILLYQQRGGVDIPFNQRQATMEIIRRDIYTLGVTEEALIEKAEAKGLSVSRRRDVMPEAFLGTEPDAALPFGWDSEKFERLEAELEGADAERVSIREKFFAAKAALTKIEERIKEEEDVARHHFGPLSAARIESNRREKDTAIAKIARLGKLLDEKQEAHTEKIAVVAACREYIEKHRRHRPSAYDGPPIATRQTEGTFHQGGPPDWFTGSR